MSLIRLTLTGLSLMATCFYGSAAGAQTTWHVDSSAQPGGDGGSWSSAFEELQSALSAAQFGDQIWVAAGVYRPDYDPNTATHTGDRERAFELVSGVAMYGAFPPGGGDGTFAARDLHNPAYETILSGDLAGDDAPGFANRDENSQRVVTSSDTHVSTMLDGFTIRGGHQEAFSPFGGGAGFHNFGGDLQIAHCRFRDNSANSDGGAIWTGAGRPVLVQCVIEDNSTSRNGGGIKCGFDSGISAGRLTLDRCTFSGNRAESSGGGLFNYNHQVSMNECVFESNFAANSGGALTGRWWLTANRCRFVQNKAGDAGAMSYAGPVTVVDSLFLRNTAAGNGGAVQLLYSDSLLRNCQFVENHSGGTDYFGLPVGGGGALFLIDSYPAVRACTFVGNSADRGGAVLVYSVDDYDGRWITLAQCVLQSNTADHDGGAVAIVENGWEPNVNNGGRVRLRNCLLARNRAGGRGGAVFDSLELSMSARQDTLREIENCTFADNIAGDASGGNGLGSGVHGAYTITNSIFWGKPSQIERTTDTEITIRFSDIQADTPAGPGNFSLDPQFVDPAAGDYHLRFGSPGLDSGDPNFAGDSVDIDGQPRLIDADNDGVAIIDVGADEAIVDCDHNGLADSKEILSGAAADCDADGVIDACLEFEHDCNGNGKPDECDIAAESSRDCNANGVPDECEPGFGVDCNANGRDDFCDIAAESSVDCNANGVPDECEVATDAGADCNGNGVPDECDIAARFSIDCDENGVPDECDVDCNGNGLPDACDIAAGTSIDCNLNGVPDECDLASGFSEDCDANGWPDECLTVFARDYFLGNLNGANGFQMPAARIDDGVHGFGAVVSRAGDINADGFADVLIAGHWGSRDERTLCYVVLGGPEAGATGDVPLDALDGENGFTVFIPAAGDEVGEIVSDAGDFNGDGVDDFVVSGAPFSGLGRGFVVYGRPGIGSNGKLDIATLAPDKRLEFIGASNPAPAGDLNGDGVDDLLLGNFTRSAYVVFGGAAVGQGGRIDVADLNGSNGFRIRNPRLIELSHLARAGDFNGDGWDDFIVGEGDKRRGVARAYVVYGGPGLGSDGIVGLGQIDGTNGFRFELDSPAGGFGGAVGGASGGGDLNGDGYDDVVIGQFALGVAFVIYGGPTSPGTDGVLTEDDLNGENGFRVDIQPYRGSNPVFLSIEGDISGDRFADLVIGWFGVEALPVTYVLLGNENLAAAGVVDVAELADGVNGFLLKGYEQLGFPWAHRVDLAGDVNGDGITDLLIGETGWQRSVGQAYVYFGARQPKDCDRNGVPDSCQIADGTSDDFDRDGVLDGCECLADIDGDRDVDLSDLTLLLINFGDARGGPTDLDDDGDTDLSDLGLLLARFGATCTP